MEPVAPHLGVVAHPAQQPVGDAGRAPGPPGDLGRSRPVGVPVGQGHAQDAGGPHHDGLEVGGAVVVESGHQAEAVAQRAGDEPGAGGGPHQGEAGQVEADGPGRRPLAQHDVELEVLHGRVEHLFDRAGQAVDLVDEQHVALVEAGEDGGQVAGPLQGRTRGDVQPGPHLDGHDGGQGGLAQTRRTGEQQVVDGLASPAGRLQDDGQVLLQLALAHELVEPPWSQATFVAQAVDGQALDQSLVEGIVVALVVGGVGAEQLVTHLSSPPTAGGPP